MSVVSGVALIVESSSMSAMVVEEGPKLALRNGLLLGYSLVLNIPYLKRKEFSMPTSSSVFQLYYDHRTSVTSKKLCS